MAEHFEWIDGETALLKTPFCGSWSGVVLIRRKSGERILIDSGASADAVDGCLIPALKEEGITLDDLTVLLCTHTHGDHVGGHFRLRELRPDLPIGVYESGADKLRDPLKYNKQIRAPFPQYSPPPSAGLRGVEPNFLCHDGEIVHGLKILSTPGHDSDCICLLDTAGGTLIAGDSIQGNGTELQGCGLCMDLPGYRRALRRLLSEPVRTVVCGHAYLPWKEAVLKGEKARKMIEEALELTEKYGIIIREALNRGITDPAEEAVYLIRALGGTMPPYLFMALFTVREYRKEWNLDAVK